MLNMKIGETYQVTATILPDNATDKTISDAKNLIKDKTISYIYTFVDEEESDNTAGLINDYGGVTGG